MVGGRGSAVRVLVFSAVLIGCGEAREVEPLNVSAAACTPGTCRTLGATCGTLDDGCGSPLDCGTCGSGTSCGGGGTPNLCGSPRCVPTTCEARGASCGLLYDGCYGELDCGSCAPGETCGGDGIPNVCGTGECEPLSCESSGAECGRVTDRCGGSIQCGECEEDEACTSSHRCVPVEPLGCADVQLGSSLPIHREISMQVEDALGTRTSGCGREGGDRVFAWTAPFKGRFVIDTAGSTFETSLTVRRGACNGESLACNGRGFTEGGSRVLIAADGGETFAIQIDGVDSTNEGTAQLHVHELQVVELGSSCSDGADNDFDGQADCADPNCRYDPTCPDGE